MWRNATLENMKFQIMLLYFKKSTIKTSKTIFGQFFFFFKSPVYLVYHYHKDIKTMNGEFGLEDNVHDTLLLVM
jgi:hypothetical protein